MLDFSSVSGHVCRSVFCIRIRRRNVPLALCHSTSPYVCHGWVVVGEFPRFPDEEEIGGEMNLVGPGGICGVGEVTSMFGPGRSSSFGQLDEDMNNDGLGQVITPYCGGEMQGRLSPNRSISLIGNTRRMGHSGDLTMVLTQSSFCRVCEHVVNDFHCPQCTMRMQHIHIVARNLE